MVRAGVFLILVSLVLLVGVPLAPLVVSEGARAGAAGMLFVASEVAFWGGVALAGRESWTMAKRYGWKAIPRELWRQLLRAPGKDPPPAK